MTGYGKPIATASGAGLALILLAVAGWLLFRTPPGPLHSITDGGQPTIDGAAVKVRAGQDATGTAFVVNSSHDPVTLTYRWQGNAYSVIAWSVDGACIKIHDCDHQGNIAQNRTEKLAGHG